MKAAAHETGRLAGGTVCSIPDAADERKNNFVKFFQKMGDGTLCEKSDVSASSGGWKRGMPSEGTEKAARVSIRIVCA